MHTLLATEVVTTNRWSIFMAHICIAIAISTIDAAILRCSGTLFPSPPPMPAEANDRRTEGMAARVGRERRARGGM
jgi:hypothetical protein